MCDHGHVTMQGNIRNATLSVICGLVTENAIEIFSSFSLLIDDMKL